ncbi:sigma factor-like helix-turn-helix DNA-binding protein [Bacillus sp. 03113]|uniref:sigma factor-like helix-turn-helix DNA-binding protein n=1 Tax=Bacillus sp. 03113 TaxID=2578211 RepID=UPI00114473AB|nr:sigma factor-like helix-turn-helix DNA-binding protein [Bacillus sp. 03113]
MLDQLDKNEGQKGNTSDRIIELYPKLKQYCSFLTKNEWDGEDIAQETILKILLQVQYHSTLNSSLLNKIAYHHWIDTIRKKQKEIIEAAPEKIEGQNGSLPIDSMDTVELLVKQLTPKQAVIFLLKEAFQYQANEIANIFETSENAVKSSYHRAKNRLKKNMDERVVEFWEDHEQKLLSSLFYQSLKEQDPKILIRSIPSISSLAFGLNHRNEVQSKSSSISPLCTFSMAA